ncbi:hypothetical protein TM7x_01330 [Candidatus Nanosynbacter lyticus]|uniref:Uncharacterized protein n=1 Tax=Candidatus Nanosynbacter lyticus TaxID=2093824 RepID=A0A6S4GUL1_9BACT|nr:hypothetical protein [Candidatus Nanosynbacter lyticus]AJA06781.1 hypothetical protein TM7x_01330 [Candidatus Nanosynbacter lyticus]QCT41420.1 hypothetical protein FBF38_01315 [TM7 phylum sp. oral taxon 952]
MNNDQYNNRNNNPDVSNAPNYGNTEKKRAFNRVVLFSIIFTIIILLGVYVSVRGLGQYDRYVLFLTEIILTTSMASSLLLISFMIRWYRGGDYQNVNKMVKDSPRAVIYSSVLSVIVFMALWLYGKSIPVDVLVLFPVIIFSVELLSCSLPTPMDIIDLLANSSFPREEDMDEWQRVDVRPTKDMKNKALRRTAVFVIICLISVGSTSTLLGILKSFAGPLGYILEALGLYILMLACISIYWYKTGRYWITDKVSKVLTAIGRATVIFYVLVVFLRFGLFFPIANKDVFIVKVLSTIDMINFNFSPIVIFLVVLIYSSWAMLSYHKKVDV